MYEHILVALDGSELAEKVLPHVQALAEKFGSKITLLRASPPIETYVAPTAVGLPLAQPMGDYTEIMETEREATTKYLNDLAEKLRGQGLQVDTDCPEGRPAEVIVERAGAVNADLIAMTTHGLGGLARLFIGSVTDEVLRHSNCPVLVVRNVPARTPPAK